MVNQKQIIENHEKKMSFRRRNVKSLYSQSNGTISPFKNKELQRRRTEWGVVAPKRPYTDDTPPPPSATPPTPPTMPIQKRTYLASSSLLNSPRLMPVNEPEKVQKLK